MNSGSSCGLRDVGCRVWDVVWRMRTSELGQLMWIAHEFVRVSTELPPGIDTTMVLEDFQARYRNTEHALLQAAQWHNLREGLIQCEGLDEKECVVIIWIRQELMWCPDARQASLIQTLENIVNVRAHVLEQSHE